MADATTTTGTTLPTSVTPESAAAEATDESAENGCQESMFLSMTQSRKSLLYLWTLPIVWIVLIAVGWSKDDIIENRVSEIWTSQRSSYKADLDYEEQFRQGDVTDSSSFAAMAIARDGGNLFTPSRLEEIRQRMEEAENATVEYKGNVFTWDDICLLNNVGQNTTYKFPCARFSPMDFFEEASWFFQEDDRVSWYTEVAKTTVIAPRIPRFGIMTGICSSLGGSSTRTECNAAVLKRVLTNEPLRLFADIGSLEMNDPCKQCIENEFESSMQQLLEGSVGMFTALAGALKQANQAELASTMDAIVSKLNLQEMTDYYSYRTIRFLYGFLGANTYLESYTAFQGICLALAPEQADNCGDIDSDEATLILQRHADHTFSSASTAGTPLPYWGDDGDGFLFQGTSPVSGSGIDLSGTDFSSTQYLGLIASQNIVADPTSAEFQTFVETDPIYRWFVAGETEMMGSCANGPLKGANGTAVDALTTNLIQSATSPWCTKFSEPFETMENRTQQYFARLWYDLLVDSPSFLNLTQGSSDPYTWTLGEGCGYDLGGRRFSYNSGDPNDPAFQEKLMKSASGELYYVDEGSSVGPIDRDLLIGGFEPESFSPENPLTSVSVLQSLYPALLADGIVKRLSNCNRPGGPIEISVEDAKEVLYRYKKAFEDAWTRGWDSENSEDEVQFVGFFDDAGGSGTTGRLLEEITLGSGVLLAISILVIAFFSIIFLYSRDPVESRVLITLLGVLLVLMAFFAAIGFGLILGIKVNINIAWTLPFIMLGLGVDDMYIVMLALRKEKGYNLSNFLSAMKEVVVPVTMTSMVNAGMFAIMNVNDVPAVYTTAQVALISVVFLYLTIIFCFPAWCWLDMQRQTSRRRDVFFCCKKSDSAIEDDTKGGHWSNFFYDKVYKPLVLGSSGPRICTHIIIWLLAIALVAIGGYGLTERRVGLGLEDFFPSDNPANRWATVSSDELAAWPISMTWGAIDYGKPATQQRMIQQYEQVIATPRVAEIDTSMLWMADLLIWSSRHCTSNFDREDPDVLACGRDQVFRDNTTCAGTWVENLYDLREKTFALENPEVCLPYEGGICRPTRQMHPDDILELGIDAGGAESWCPVIDGWSEEKFGFCLQRWRELTGGGGNLVLLNETGTPRECSGEFDNDENVLVPIPISSSPTMYAYNLLTHENTLDMLAETRAICDDDPELRCFLSGIPFDYWSQYVGIFGAFAEIAGYAIGIGFVIAFAFLLVTLGSGKAFVASFVGAFLITLTTILSLVSVAGLSVLAGVNLTGFSNMSMVLSVGFSVEYSVHVVSRWLRADPALEGIERVEHTMSFLFLPTFMSFVSSLIGVVCLAFTEFEFNEVFFFRPLILVMPITYFFGCWWLPVALSHINAGFEGKEVNGDTPKTEGSVGKEVNEGTPKKEGDQTV